MPRQFELRLGEVSLNDLVDLAQKEPLETAHAKTEMDDDFRKKWWALTQNIPTFSLWEKLYIAGDLSEEKKPIYLAAKQYRLNHPLK